ncbi:hypothetical protein BGZ63DRAFT_390286 [Mariannaea sp. PMI_226]|nr:hypothetical protein BGZ63DRAFT_390286 [Mariannaea sp. PMI_226]
MHHQPFGTFPAAHSADFPCNPQFYGATPALASPPLSPANISQGLDHQTSGPVGSPSSDANMGYSHPQELPEFTFTVAKRLGGQQTATTNSQLQASAASPFSCPQDTHLLRPPLTPFTPQAFALAPSPAITPTRNPVFPRLAQPVIEVSPAAVATQHPLLLYPDLSPPASTGSTTGSSTGSSNSPLASTTPRLGPNRAHPYWLCGRKSVSRVKKMSRRPPKRSGSPGDVGHSGQPLGENKVKLPKLDRTGDFSGIVKNRLQSYTRTGQACDRCKVRKIRCDALPEGCSHCKNQNLECLVTDRVTGRTERRGYLQELERKESDLVEYIRDLEKLLHDKGVQVKPYESPPGSQYPPGTTLDDMDSSIQDPNRNNGWSQKGSVVFKDSPSNASPPIRRALLESRRGEAHIGVRGDDSAPLSSINGTHLSILGMTIDMASFKDPDVDEPPHDAKASTPLYNKSIQAFLQSTMHINPALDVPLPERSEAFKFAEFYFLTIGCFLPIPHKPTFMNLLVRIYDEPNFVPTTTELVQVHMVFAIIFYQFAVRNWDQPQQRHDLDSRSNQHYHFALGKIFSLTCEPDFAAVQVMALICIHTRAFPKPGCASLIAQHALQRALELGLHRESRKPGESTNLNHEMRKRVWWVILTINVAISGRRGLPMPITVQDFDVGFPEPISDELLRDDGVDTSRNLPCSYEVAICSFKFIPHLIEMWANVYCVRRDAANYTNIVKVLEARIKTWADELPDRLKLGHPEQLAQSESTKMEALFLRSFLLEFRLLLRHPSVAMTNNEDMKAENSRICEEVAKEILHTTLDIQSLRCLDTTWYQTSFYAASMFTTLVAHWERRMEMTPDDFDKLRKDMESWVSILEETGNLLGSGPQISEEIKKIINHTMALIETDMCSKNQGVLQPAPTTPKLKQEPQHSFQSSDILRVPVSQAASIDPSPLPTATISAPVPTPNGMSQPDVSHKQQYYQEPPMNSQTNSYPTLAYNNQTHNNMTPQPSYDAHAMYYNQAQAAAAVASTVQGASMSFAQPNQHMAVQQQTDMLMNGRGTPWHDWTAAMAGTQDRYIATPFPTLGSSRDTNTGSLPGEAPSLTTNDINEMWPMTLMPHQPGLE